MRFLLPILFFLTTASLIAQDTHAFYNLFTDSLYFQRDGKTLRKPRLKKGDRVVVHFTEFNPYLYAAESEVLLENDPAANAPTEGMNGMGSLAMLMPGMGAMGAGAMPGLSSFMGNADSSTGLLGFMNKPLLSLGSTSFRLNNLFSKESTRSEVDFGAVQAQLAELSRLQAEMEQVYIDINESKQAVAAAAMAAPFFETVVKSPELRPSLIKQLGAEYVGLIYPGKTAAQLEVRDAFGWQNRAVQHQQLLQEFNDLQTEYAQKAVGTTETARQISNLADQFSDNETFGKFATDLTALGRQNTNFQRQATRYLAGQKSEQAVSGLSMPELLAQQVRFREIAGQSFSYETVVHVEDETTVLSATFTALDSIGGASKSKTGPAGKTKIVKLQTSGGMRFTSGVGLSFGGFGGASQEFSVRNSVIVAEDNSALQPMLSSFAHIYPRRKGRTTLGGSFGVGIPLGSGAVQMPHFFFGPTLLFGGQKVALTGGLMLGPVSKLAKGYAPGDAFDLNVAGEIPTRNKYESGWFVGFSFNMAR